MMKGQRYFSKKSEDYSQIGKGDYMEDMTRRFFAEYSDEEIQELDLEELARVAGGDGKGVKCPKCGERIPIRSLKEHLRTVHNQ